MKTLLKIFVTIILGAIAIVLAMQDMTKIWDFPEAKPFSGTAIFNPYAGISAGKPYTETFLKGNFHAHTCFDTRHDYTTEEFIDAYKIQGYSIIGITDHQYINPKGIVPSYEHGYGLNNFHIGMYNTDHVDWIDNVYMFLPPHQMQSMFKRLDGESDVIVFNHSDRLRLMDDSGIEFLRGYDLFELYPTAVGEIWDRVLSTGFYIPLVANDDAHSIINRDSQFQRAYTMVYSEEKDPLKALLMGHSYAVCVSNERNMAGHIDMPQITGISLLDDKFSVSLDRKSDSIRFIGQGGKVLQRSDSLEYDSYAVCEDDTYVRAEIFFDGIKMFTNPIARMPKGGFFNEMPTVNYPLTILNWLFWTVLVLLDIFLIFKIWHKGTGGGDNYYKRGRRAHYENVVIGAGLKPIEWN